MEIKYSAMYRTEAGNRRVINGVLTESDLERTVSEKEDKTEFQGIPAELEFVSWESVNI